LDQELETFIGVGYEYEIARFNATHFAPIARESALIFKIVAAVVGKSNRGNWTHGFNVGQRFGCPSPKRSAVIKHPIEMRFATWH